MTIAIEPIEHDGLIGHVARAVRAGGGGVLLLPTIFGVNAFARDTAARLAGLGLTTVIWDPYPGEVPPTSPQEGLKRVAAWSDGRATGEMSRWIGVMTSRLGLGAVGYVGFCLGGRYGFILAANDKRIACGVSFYPSIEDPRHSYQEEDAVALAARIECPIHVLYPYGDHVTKRATFLKLDASLKSCRAPTTVQIYPEAAHSFMELGERAGPADKRAAAAAWPQATAFLQAYLT